MRKKWLSLLLVLIGVAAVSSAARAQVNARPPLPERSSFLCEIQTPVEATGAGGRAGTPHYYAWTQERNSPAPRDGDPCEIANVGRGRLVQNTGQTVTAPGAAGTEWLCMIGTAPAAASGMAERRVYYSYMRAQRDPVPSQSEVCGVTGVGHGTLTHNEGQAIAGSGAVVGAAAASAAPSVSYLCDIALPNPSGNVTRHEYFAYTQGPNAAAPKDGDPCEVANVGKGRLVRNTGQTVTAAGAAGTQWLCMITQEMPSGAVSRRVYYTYVPGPHDPAPQQNAVCNVPNVGRGTLTRNEGQAITGGGAALGAGNPVFACRFTSGRLNGETLTATGDLVLKGPRGALCTDNFGSNGVQVER